MPRLPRFDSQAKAQLVLAFSSSLLAKGIWENLRLPQSQLSITFDVVVPAIDSPEEMTGVTIYRLRMAGEEQEAETSEATSANVSQAAENTGRAGEQPDSKADEHTGGSANQIYPKARGAPQNRVASTKKEPAAKKPGKAIRKGSDKAGEADQEAGTKITPAPAIEPRPETALTPPAPTTADDEDTDLPF